MKPTVVVLGATGQVGLFALAGLLEAGRNVVAVTRHESEEHHAAIQGLSRCGAAQVGPFLRRLTKSGDPALLSCGPIGLASEVLELHLPDRGHALERLVAIGTTSIEVKRDSPDAAERTVVKEIETGLEYIRRRCASLDIPLTVLNPTLIYGCGMDQNLSRVKRWIGRTGFAPLAAGAQGRRQPLHVGDLAATLVNAVEAKPATNLETAVAGGEIVEYEEMIARLFDAAGRDRRMLRLPEYLLAPVAGLSRLLPGIGRVSSETFRRQSCDQLFNDRLARQVLRHAPRPFQPKPEDFELPQNVARIRQALL